MEEQACLIKDQAKMMSAVACAEVNFHGIFFRCEKIDLCVNHYILWLSLSALLKIKQSQVKAEHLSTIAF